MSLFEWSVLKETFLKKYIYCEILKKTCVLLFDYYFAILLLLLLLLYVFSSHYYTNFSVYIKRLIYIAMEW